MHCEETIQQGIDQMRLHLDDAAVNSLCKYFAELVKWNRKMNLVAAAAPRDVIENHFLDSLTLLPLLASSGNLMDVGTGAGFPGLVLKTVMPALEVTLVEPRKKRVSFLNHLVRTLQLDKINIITDRLDRNKILPELAGRFQVITSRAFTSIGGFLELTAPYNIPGGKVICMKGPGAANEVADWKKEFPQSRYELITTHTSKLPFSGKERNLLEFTFR